MDPRWSGSTVLGHVPNIYGEVYIIHIYGEDIKKKNYMGSKT